ncbi:MAG TPA: hypothetical protein VFV17_07805, partial [Usitatibacteraceae bacterium]|nr:hypothetical protein [Usitatibacteraceae bacterium]
GKTPILARVSGRNCLKHRARLGDFIRQDRALPHAGCANRVRRIDLRRETEVLIARNTGWRSNRHPHLQVQQE